MSKEFMDPDKPIGIIELLNPCFSPAVVVSQYLSCLVRGVAPKLRLLWQWFGRATMYDFTQAHADHWTWARAMFKAVSGMSYRRNGAILKELEWRVCSVADTRLSQGERNDVVVQVRSRGECCTGRAAKSVVAWPTIPQVFLAAGQAVVRGYALALTMAMSVADIERKHKVAKVPTI